jgi:nicotinamidase/pyrazinamidase
MKNTERTRNVLVAVDVQNDFISGSLAVNEGEQVVEPLNDVAAAVRQSGGDVVFTRDWHPCNTLHFNDWPAHCVRHTEGAAFHPDLIVEPQDIIISKGTSRLQHGYSGWEGTSGDGGNLESLVMPKTPLEKVRVFIGGLATDYCVKATALDASHRFDDDGRVELYLLRDAVRAVNIQAADGEEALKAILDAGVVALSCEEARSLIEKEL